MAMGGKFRFLTTTALLSFVSIAPITSVHANSGGIQMLPPMDFSGKPCDEATGGLLQWDGVTSIKCVPGTAGDMSGDLLAKGDVQVGASNAACTSANAGAIRFNKSTNAFEGCNGTVWGAFGGGSGWVSLPPGGAPGQAEIPLGAAPAAFYPNADISPTQWCQENGYTAAAGACLGTVAYRGYTEPVEGVIEAGGLSPLQEWPTSNEWAWMCDVSGTVGISSGDVSGVMPSQILCTH